MEKELNENNPKHHATNYTAYFILFFLGLGNLLPFQAFITAESYFKDRLCGSSWKNNFEIYFNTGYNIAQPLGLFISLGYGRFYSKQAQVRIPLIIYTIVFTCTMILSLLDINQNLLFYLTLICNFICGLVGSIMNGGLYGIAALLPSKYTSALMIGSASAGLLLSFTSLITSLTSVDINCNQEDDVYAELVSEQVECEDFYIDTGSVAYFSLSTFSLVMCIVLFQVFLDLPIYKQHKSLTENINSSLSSSLDDNIEEDIIRMSLNPHMIESEVLIMSAGIAKQDKQSRRNSVIRRRASEEDTNSYTEISDGEDRRSTLSHIDITSSLLESQNKNTTPSNLFSMLPLAFQDILLVLYHISSPASAVFLTYVVTMSIFPAVLVLIIPNGKCATDSKTLNTFNEIWIPFLFIIFNVFDFAGRLFAERSKEWIPINGSNIWIYSMARFVFFILFLFCNVQDTRLVHVDSNFYVLINLIAFSFTSGYIANLAMMFGPNLVGIEDSSLAGIVMITSLILGLTAGSLLSFLIVYIIRGEI